MRHRLLLNALCLQQLEDVKATQIDNCSYRVGSMPSPFILWLIDITFIIFRWCYNGRHNFVNKIYIFWIREKVRYRKIVFRPVNSWLPCHQTKIYHWHDHMIDDNWLCLSEGVPHGEHLSGCLHHWSVVLSLLLTSHAFTWTTVSVNIKDFWIIFQCYRLLFFQDMNL